MNHVMTKRDRAILIGVFGIIAVVVAFFLVFRPYTEKKKTLDKENQALKARVDVLQSLTDQKTQLETATDENNKQANEILAKYPANVYEEDILMMAVRLEDEAPFEAVTEVDMGAPEVQYTFADITGQAEAKVNGDIPEGVASNSEEADTESGNTADATAQAAPAAPVESPILYHKKAEILNILDYDGLKEAIRLIVENDEKCTLAVNAVYDIETGVLESNIAVGRYYLTGTDKAYQEIDIPHVVQGTDNIFGTVSLMNSRAVRYSNYTEDDIVGNESDGENTEEEVEESEDTEQ